MTIRSLVWTRNSSQVLNGKVGPLTLATVALHTTLNRFFVSMKLPGHGKAIPVGSEREGMAKAEGLYGQFVSSLIEGAP